MFDDANKAQFANNKVRTKIVSNHENLDLS